MTDKLSVADVLDRAAVIVSPKGAWQQFRYASNNGGDAVAVSDPTACSFCAMGAVYRASGATEDHTPEVVSLARNFMANTFDRSMANWNDDPKRTQSQVVSKLREAANLARERGL